MTLEEILHKLEQSTEITFDFETDELHHKLLNIDGISFASDKLEPVFVRKSEYLPVEFHAFMKKVFAIPAVFIGHNLQFDCKVLKHFFGISLDNKFDTMIASWYLDENRPKGLKDLSANLLGTPMDSYKSHVKESEVRRKELALRMAEEELGEDAKKKDIKARQKELIEELPLDDGWLDEYSSLDAEQTYKLYKLFKPLLEKEGLYELFSELEMPFIDVLIDMSLEGICIDLPMLKKLEIELTEKKMSLENSIYALVGEFNIGSTVQLSEKLYGIKVSRTGGVTRLLDAREPGREYVRPPGKTKTGAPATDKAALEKLPDSKFVNLIREYRGVAKMLNTYAIGYSVHAVDGKIYPNFNGDGRDTNDGGTVTGRLSCSKPNMMNLPRDRPETGVYIRDAFYAPEGYKLIVTDESQLELRLLAHESKDEGLVSAFMSGLDVHYATAQQILARNDISPQERSYFKTINFAIMYGMSAVSLSERLKISKKEAQSYLNMYFEVYSGVKEWMDYVKLNVKRKGYVTTIIGRKRRLPDIWSKNYGYVSRAERQAVNSIIQGSAADILKVAMLRTNQQFREANLDAHIQLQIHDELVIVAKDSHVEQACAIIQDNMEHPFAEDLSVPLIAEPKIVQRWGETKE